MSFRIPALIYKVIGQVADLRFIMRCWLGDVTFWRQKHMKFPCLKQMFLILLHLYSFFGVSSFVKTSRKKLDNL